MRVLSQSTADHRHEQRTAELRAAMDAAIARLAQQLQDGHTAEYEAFLRFYSRFWTYSIRNTILIHQQYPQATRCAGMKLWNDLGYRVRRGEQAIWIWAPTIKKLTDEDTGQEAQRVVGFVPAPVFDASQVESPTGQTLPSPFPVLPDDANDAYALCVAKVTAQGIAVEERTDLPPGIYGTSRPGTIRVAATLDSRNRLFVLIHELVHQIWHHDLHDTGASLQQLEFEAESVTYVVAAVMGLEHPSARDYLLGYRVTAQQLKLSLAVIQIMVRHVLRLLELPFDVMHQPEAMAA